MKHKSLKSLFPLFVFMAMLPLSAAAAPSMADLLTAGHVDEAIGALHSHLQASPNDAEAHALLMRAYYAKERWDEAISAGQKAVSLAPNNSTYHMFLGRTYGEKAGHANPVSAYGLAKKARAEFERAVALDGGNIKARSDLAEFYVDAPSFLGGGKDKAAAQAEQMHHLGHEAKAHWVRSKIAEADKNYGAAEQELQAAIRSSNWDPEYILNLASFYRRRGRMKEVESTVNQAVSAANQRHNGQSLYDAAELLYRSGRNFNGAIGLLHNYISSSQHSEDAPVFRAHYLMGTILEKMGNKSAAAQQYRAALQLARDFQPAQTSLRRVQ
jgi:tetratricopeptide (TPR) repeat protein